MDQENKDEQIEKLRRQLEELERLNSNMYFELKSIKRKLELYTTFPSKPLSDASEEQKNRVENEELSSPKISLPEPKISDRVEETPIPKQEKPVVVQQQSTFEPVKPQVTKPIETKPKPKTATNWEKFIGENLINKIGILITVIGVGIGTKYAIDHQLISPQLRIILGYIVGLGLMGFALKLKAKYHDFSAVLLSGSMAILYFLTFISYILYGFFSVELTFALMTVFTAFTVFAAIKYDRQIIAHLGLVGAFGIPFLLSDGSGKVAFFFTYIAIINSGILTVSFFKKWKALYYSSYGLTWLIYAVWFIVKYDVNSHFSLALTFLTVFFILFHLQNLAYKLWNKEKFEEMDFIQILGNSFLFFGFGCYIVNGHEVYTDYLGLFCLINALIHFATAFYASKREGVDRNLVLLSAALVLTFVTITLPVQFEGNTVNISWSVEALVLLLIARFKKVHLFEHLSYPIYALAIGSLVIFLVKSYSSGLIPDLTFFKPSVTVITEFKETINKTIFFNSVFLSSFISILVLGTTHFLNRRTIDFTSYTLSKTVFKQFRNSISYLFLLVLFGTLFFEISHHWDLYITRRQLALEVFRKNQELINLEVLKTCTLIVYSMVFVAVLSFLRKNKKNSVEFKTFVFFVTLVVLLVFVTFGLMNLRYIKYMTLAKNTLFSEGFLYFLRIIIYGVLALFLTVFYRFSKKQFQQSGIIYAAGTIVFSTVALIFLLEVDLFWDVRIFTYKIEAKHVLYALKFKNIELYKAFTYISYVVSGLVVLLSLIWLRMNKEKNESTNAIVFVLSMCATVFLLFFGLYNFNFLQINYLYSKQIDFGFFSLVLVRYIVYALIAFYVWSYLRFMENHQFTNSMKKTVFIQLQIMVLWILSAELVNWMHIFESKQAYKLGLSIFWGLYSLGFIAIGIWKKKAFYRIGAISLFGLTLVKLFFYDLVHLSTISKTIVFLSLGVLLLIISFLYTKYKNVLFEDEK